MQVENRLGTIERMGEHIDVRFERHYGRPIELVWKALTDPQRMADWLGQSAVEPWIGGRYDTMLDGPKPMLGRVRIWEPPTLLEYDWHSDHAPVAIARWELTANGSGTRLIFRHTGIPYANANLMMPGWHVYLDHLGQALDGTAPTDFTTAWREQQERYAAAHDLGHLTREP